MKRILTAAIISLLLISNTGISQSKLIVQLFAGYLLPLPDFKGDIPPKAGDDNYQMKSGINFGANGKYSIDKSNIFRITASLSYNMCSNSGDIAGVTNSLEEHKINIFSAGAGLEFAYPSKKKIIPFLGAEFTANIFSGKYEYEIGDSINYIRKLKGESRFGILFSGGIDVALEKNMGFVVGAKYNIANLIGKTSSISDYEINLNDEEYIENGVTIAAKSIKYLQIYAGISVYFLQPKIKKNK